VKKKEKYYFPAKEHPYFVNNPYGDGLVFFANEKERDNYAADCIQTYLDDGWDEEVENVVAGVVTHRATQVDRVEKPPEEDLDEEGCDEDGTDWRDVDFLCGYKLLPL
jgi:hypothetical protein